MSYQKNWCFTLNNYSEDDLEKYENLGQQTSTTIQYLIYGKEVGENGTPHLQGFVQFKKRLRIRQVKDYLGSRVHVEPANGTPAQNQVYCQKEEDFVEFKVFKFQLNDLSSVYLFNFKIIMMFKKRL